MADFALLRNERAYLRWYSDALHQKPTHWSEFDTAADHRKSVKDWREGAMSVAPAAYPVLASTTVESYSYEESQPVYVYADDARRLLASAALDGLKAAIEAGPPAPAPTF